eukprot:TRINITY_DN46869_c0_g1_i1.p1 TRINITY_DN46869_c0_g1~~TRINITY_DN46869_c0_g1_i1.p1  ORF type:complete len:973 (+),score=404.17 TRINITY_DN46869_c0_g1_i1:62-2920(+)
MSDATFKVDYAKSSRSKCNACKQEIPQGEMRVGPMEQSPTFDGKIPRWHHISCFEDRWLKRNAGALTSIDQVGGVSALRFEDQKRVKALCTGGSADDAATHAESAEEKAYEAQSKKIHTLKDALRANCSAAEIRDLLENNNQPSTGKVFGGEDKCALRCAECLLFGALPKCDECDDGDFICTRGKYVCVGNVDEFTKCSVEKDDIKRLPFKVPQYMKSANEYLSKLKPKKEKKLLFYIADSNPTPTQPSTPPPKKRRVEAAAAAAPAPAGAFGGLSVTAAGRTAQTTDEIKEIVEGGGGKYVARGDKFDYLVTSRKDASGKTKKITDAIKKGKILVTEGWLDSCVHAGAPVSGDELKKFCLANMPEDGGSAPKPAEAAAAAKPASPVSKSGAVTSEEREKRKRLADEALVAAKRRELEKAADDVATGKSAASAKSAGRQEKKTLTVKGGAAVEEDSGLVDEGTIYKKGDAVYTCTMNRTDVSSGANSFYILQLIKHDGKDMYSVFRKWGKIGTPIGDKKREDFPLLMSAQRQFETLFQEKTGNTFQAYVSKSFQKKPNKFMVLEVDYGGGSAAQQQQQAQQGYTGSLDDPTQKLMTLLFDIKEMEAALMQMEIDTRKMPLGKLSKATLKSGLSALTDITKVLDQHPDGFDDLEPDEKRRQKAKLAGLANKFYTLIPHVFDGEAPALIDSKEMVLKKNELVNTLMEMEVATSLMQQQVAPGEHPIDANYSKLKCDFQSVAKDDDIFKMVDEYLQNTHAKTHNMYTLELEDLWEIDREGEAGRYKKWESNGNRQLLWHGSRLTNWVGIISQGLRIAPPEAPATGYMFGKGIYFADMSSKSANYCFTSSEKTTGIMLLSEVALGDMFENLRSNYVTKLPSGKLSCKGVGTTAPNPKGTVTLPNGCVVPKGKGGPSNVKGSSLRYNEYIVYDVSQVRMKYLLRVNFKYKTKCGTFF